MLELILSFFKKLRGISSWVFSLAFISAFIALLDRLMKRRAIQKSEESATTDNEVTMRKLEFVETEWDKIGSEIDKQRDKK